MTGSVDQAGRALLALQVRSAENAPETTLTVWVDTAFDGELVVSESVIGSLGLKQSAAVQAMLADGSTVVLETFHCQILWFGEWRAVEVVANEGRLPLLGIGLLRDRRLIVDYRTQELTID